MQTDPISDFLTRIRNAIAADHRDVEIPSSGLKKEMSRLLKEQGYIDDFSVEPATVGEVVKITLRYTEDRRSVITGMKRVSRPGRRRYVTHNEVPACSAAWAPRSSRLPRRDDRPRRQGQGRRRRGRCLHLVVTPGT